MLALAASLALALAVAVTSCLSGDPDNPTLSPRDPGLSAEAHDPCGPSRLGYSGEFNEHFLHWARGGSHLVFDVDDTIWTLDVESGLLQQVADADADYDYESSARGEGHFKFIYGFHADVRPDRFRIVYATCEYLYVEPAVDRWGEIITYSEGYEIATVDLAGDWPVRITENSHIDSYPVWSPDGSQVAFVAYAPGGEYPDRVSHYPNYFDRHQSKIAILPANGMFTDTEQIRWLWPTKSVALYPPVWSPDGQYLAFTANEGERRPFERVLTTIRLKSTKLTTLGETTALPTWSPDSERLAFAAVVENKTVIYVVKPDGSDLREVWKSTPDAPSQPISELAWSPDGSELLFISDRTYLVRPDGSDHRRRLGVSLKTMTEFVRPPGRPMDHGLPSTARRAESSRYRRMEPTYASSSKLMMMTSSAH